MKLRTRVRLMSAIRPAADSSSLRAFGLGALLGLFSRRAGMDDVSAPIIPADLERSDEHINPPSLFRKGFAAREVDALVAAADGGLFCTVHAPGSQRVLNAQATYREAEPQLNVGDADNAGSVGFGPREASAETVFQLVSDDEGFVIASNADESFALADADPGSTSPTTSSSVLVEQLALDDDSRFVEQETATEGSADQVTKPASDPFAFLKNLTDAQRFFALTVGGVALGGGQGGLASLLTGSSYSGAVIDGYVANSFVFADIDGNGEFTVNLAGGLGSEPYAYTDASGFYTFSTTLDISRAPIIALGGTDITTGATVNYLAAPSGVPFVTPISTLVHYAAATGGGDVLGALGLVQADLMSDPVQAYTSGGNGTLTVERAESMLLTGAAILTAVSAAAALVGSVADVGEAEATRVVFEKLSSRSAADLEKLSSSSSLDPSSMLGAVIADSLAEAGALLDASVIQGAAEAIGSVAREVRSGSVANGQITASVGQIRMASELAQVGRLARNGEDVTAWVDSLKSDYSTRLDALKAFQQSFLDARKATGPSGVTLANDVITVRPLDGDSFSGSFAILANDRVNVDGKSLILTRVSSVLPEDAMPDWLHVSVSADQKQIDVRIDEGFDPASPSSYGDFYFTYTAALDDAPSVQGRAMVTLQVAPDPKLDAMDVSLVEAVDGGTPLALRDLIMPDRLGPGDSVFLSGLPAGTTLLDGTQVVSTASTGGALLIGPQLLRSFAQLSLVLPGDFSGEASVEASLTSRYGGAVTILKAESAIRVSGAADGPLAMSGLGTELAVAARKEAGALREDVDFPLFGRQTVLPFLSKALSEPGLALKDADGSERLAIAIGVPDGWTLRFDPKFMSEPAALGGGLQWIVLRDAPDGTLLQALSSVEVIPPNDFSGSVDLQAAVGSFEKGNPASISFASPFSLMTSVVIAQPEPLLLSDTDLSVLVQGGSRTVGDTISIDLNSAFDAGQLAEPLTDSDRLESIRLEIRVPAGLQVLPSQSGDNWVLLETAPNGDGRYALDGVDLSRLWDRSLPSLQLAPDAGFSTPANGIALRLNVTTSVRDPLVDPLAATIASNGATDKEVVVRVKPAVDIPGSVLPSVKSISLVESQGGDNAAAWQSLESLIDLPAASRSGEQGRSFVVVETSSLDLRFGIRQSSGQVETLAPQYAQAGESVRRFEVPIEDFAKLLVSGVPYRHGSFSINIGLRTSIAWDQESLEATGAMTSVSGSIRPVASGIQNALDLVQQGVGVEGQTFALSAFIRREALPRDIDSESVRYVVTLPRAFRVVSGDDATAALPSRISADGADRIYELSSATIGKAVIVAPQYLSGDAFRVGFQAFTQEVDGSRSYAAEQFTNYKISPVSNAPWLVAPANLSMLLVTADSKIDVPIVTGKVDPDEVLDVRIEARIASGAKLSASDIEFFVHQITGGVTTEISLNVQEIGNALVIRLSDPELVALLPSLAIRSPIDLRGNDRLSLTLSAGSSDGSAARAEYRVNGALPTVDIAIYQPLSPPEVTVSLAADAYDKAAGTLEFSLLTELPSSPKGLGADDVSLLMIGVPEGAYFLSEGIPTGASLGGGIWLFNGDGLLTAAMTSPQQLTAKLQLVGVNGSFSASVRAVLTDVEGGSAASSSASSSATLNFSPPAIDPLVVSFSAKPGSDVVSATDQLRVDFDPDLSGFEMPLAWFQGALAAGIPSGTALLVRADADLEAVELRDLYANVGALVAELDSINAVGSDMHAYTLDDFERAGLRLWFDTDHDAVADAGEVVAIGDVFSEFILLPAAKASADERQLYASQQASVGVGNTVLLDQIAELSYQLKHSSQGVEAAKLLAVMVPNIPAGTSSLSEFAANGASGPSVRIEFNQPAFEDAADGLAFAVHVDPPVLPDGLQDPSITHLVKIYGIPSEAILSSGVLVEQPGKTPYWVIAMSGDALSEQITIRGLPLHFAGKLDLWAQGITSVVSVGGGAFTLAGDVSGHAVIDVIGVADVPLMLPLSIPSEEINEGGHVALSTLGIGTRAADLNETLTYYLRITEADADVPLGIRWIAESSAAMPELNPDGFWKIRSVDLDRLQFQLPQFAATDIDVAVRAKSAQGESEAWSERTEQVRLAVNAVADGIVDGSISVLNAAGSSDRFVEGDGQLRLQARATAVDPKENSRYEVLAGGSDAAFDAVVSIAGLQPVAIRTIESRRFKVFELAADEAETARIEMNPYFDGAVEVIANARSVDAINGVESDLREIGKALVDIAARPGANESYEIIVEQGGKPVDRLVVREGDSGEGNRFVVKIISFDENERFSIAAPGVQVLGEQQPTQLPSGARVFVFNCLVEGPARDARGISLSLTVSEGELSEVVRAELPLQVIRTAEVPVLDTTPVRIVLESDGSHGPSAADGADLPTHQPSLTADDVLTYRLSNVPATVGVRGGTLVGTKDGVSSFQFTRSQLGDLRFVALTGLLATAADIHAMTWQAFNREPTTGEVSASDSVSIYAAPPIYMSGLQQDNLAGNALVLDGATTSIAVNGGLTGERISYQALVRAPRDTVELARGADPNPVFDLVFAADALASAGVTMSWRQPVSVNLSYGSDPRFGQVEGDMSSNVLVLPNPANWSGSVAAVEKARAFFGDGFFGDLPISADAFVFIDPDFGEIVSDSPTLYGAGASLAEGITNIFGTEENDYLVAQDSGAVLYGAGGWNELLGGSGADILIAGARADLMTGGAGDDIFQISLDAAHDDLNRYKMDSVLERVLGLNANQRDKLMDAIADIHQQHVPGGEIWESESVAYRFNGVVTDYSRSEGNADRLAFTGGSDMASVETHVIDSSIWGGHSDFIYAFAKEFSAASDGIGGELSFTAALLMPEFSPIDVGMLDLEAQGVYKI